jgi:hypothetical protein
LRGEEAQIFAVWNVMGDAPESVIGTKEKGRTLWYPPFAILDI